MPRDERPVRRGMRTSDGVNLSVVEFAAPNARRDLTIALIPGWCMPAAIWAEQIAAFGRHYHTIALDPRGQGESEVPQDGYNFARRAADVHEFLAPYRNVLLVGWSLGALEALKYAHQYGEDKLACLALIDSSVGEMPVPPPGSGFLDALREDRDKALDEFVRAMYARPRTEDEYAALLKDIKRMPLESSIALLSSGIAREHWRAIAHAFAKPLLYVVTPQFAEQAANLKKNRPGTRVELFEEAGHALFADEPERFNALLMAFAASV